MDYEEVMSRLIPKFRVSETGCWEWLAGKNVNGYGRFNVDGSTRLAHRVVYEIMVGPIPEELEIDHLCRNTSCVNPAHLEAVTHAENMRRGMGGENQRVKTHCPQGHPYEGDNLYINPASGARMCRACQQAAYMKRRAKKEESA